jgi:hypothetical protein
VGNSNMAAMYSNGLTAGIFLASILLKEMRYLVYIRYLWSTPGKLKILFECIGDERADFPFDWVI